MSEHDEAHEIRSDVADVGEVAGGASLVLPYAVDGAASVAEGAIAGTVTEAATGTAIGAGGFIAAGAVGAFAIGYEAGSVLEEHTHIGQHLGDAIYDAVHPSAADPYRGMDGIDYVAVPGSEEGYDGIDTVLEPTN